ncbi:TBP-associated factor 5 [Perilla frutescens var. hirtella]|nr:TBP-associated factor 5 [Perilla frutescens var. hirtella]
MVTCFQVENTSPAFPIQFKSHASIRRQLLSHLTVNYLPFSCEGSLLASGSADCTVKIWDVATSSKVPKADENSKSGSTSRLRSLKTLPTKSSPVYALQFSKRNLLFAAGALSKQS